MTTISLTASLHDWTRVAKSEAAFALLLQEIEKIQTATAGPNRLFVGLCKVGQKQIQGLASEVESEIEQLPVLAANLPRLQRVERRSEERAVDLIDER